MDLLSTQGFVKEAAIMAGSITVLVTFGWKVTKWFIRVKASVHSFKKTWDSYGARLDEVHVLCQSVDTRLARLVALQRAQRDLEGVATFEANEHGSFVHVSHGWTRLTGSSLDAARGYGWLSAVHPESREQVREMWKDALSSGEPFDRVFYVEHGTRVRAQARPLYESGKIVGWVGLWDPLEPETVDDSHPNMIRTRPH
jgi:PAS domain S-box-containing protein